ncbi:MAG: efflux transporter periplasmic adaptor subunit, partial [Hyphomicrobium sp.]|nr:efflux transporter periplasmic adaptor subunit [Hyphomicrobium sp.]
SAIGTEQVRKFVYVLNGENVATPKYVTLGQLVDGLRVVKGLNADDAVVINGLMRIRPGAKVAPEQAAADAGGVRDTSSIRTN